MNCSNNYVSQQCAAESVGTATAMFANTIKTFLAFECAISPAALWPKNYGNAASKYDSPLEFDFIIVGGGGGGCVVAGRLSENPNYNVLLLEAGGNPPIESEIPSLFGNIQQTKFDWNFHAKAETSCKASKTSTCYCPRGKMIGGSTALNGMIYTRGNKADYDFWSSQGCTGWDFKSILPYFKKSEGNQYQPFVDDVEYHNGSGPMLVNFFSSNDGQERYRQIFLQAANQSGQQIIDDINSNKPLGFLNMQATIAKGRRQSSAKSYLVPAENRKNLHVIEHVQVTKILIDKNKNAYGVKYTFNGTEYKAIARKEVIVSAGTFQSPQLLMLSGVGPAKHLKEFKIPVKSDIPVGRNLRDHCSIYIWFQFNPTPANPYEGVYNTAKYVLHSDGALNSRGVANINGFINLANETGVPQFQFQAFYYKQNSSGLSGFTAKQNYTNGIKKALLAAIKDYDVAAVVISNLHPTSVGYVKLASRSINDYPIVNPKYLSTAEDVDISVEYMKNQLSYENTESYQKNGGQFPHIPIPECDQYEFRSEDYLRCYIRYFGSTNSHLLLVPI